MTARVLKQTSLADLTAALRSSWSAATSVSPERWTASTPSLGQCAVTALVLQDYLGGELHRGIVGETSHYWLQTGSGDIIDLTLEQFSNPTVVPTGVRDRDYVLSSESTSARYRTLADAVVRHILEYERS